MLRVLAYKSTLKLTLSINSNSYLKKKKKIVELYVDIFVQYS